GNVVFAAELARRYGTEGIVSTSINPVNFTRCINLWDLLTVNRRERCRYTLQNWGLLRSSTQAPPQKFLIPWAKIGKAAPSTADPEVGRKLWEWLEAQVVDA
ncbi:hypothetical protein B0H13DRAFT_1911303, partial [Mycena leptocephala]